MQLGKPVALLNEVVREAKLFCKLVRLFLQFLHVNGADNLDFRAGGTRRKAACFVHKVAVRRKPKGQAVALCDKLGKGAALGNGGAVCGVNARYKLLKAGGTFVKL